MRRPDRLAMLWPRRAPARPATALTLAVLAALLSGCGALSRKSAPPEPPTLKSLAGRRVTVITDSVPAATTEQAQAAWRGVLELKPTEAQRAEALRRLGDLEMDRVDARVADGRAAGVVSDYAEAIQRYQAFLAAYPTDPGNDRVYYQMARAYEQGGDLKNALAWLDRVVKEFPQTGVRDEAEFRRGELLFSARNYPAAERAYADVLKAGDRGAFSERALYMLGWSQYKQEKLDAALGSFFGVLDLKIPGRQGEAGIDTLPGLSRADRELVEDTFRIIAISLAAQKGAETIPPYIQSDERRGYEVHVYQQLAELYLKQERVKDAADTYALFARLRPLHLQAPVMQARVIDIYQDTGFAALALQAKKDYVAQYGVASEFRRTHADAWQRAQPLVKTHLAELAQNAHAQAQRSKSVADADEAVRWYRELITGFPGDAATPRNHFLMAELLFESNRHADAAREYEKTAYTYPPHEKSAEAGYAALLAHTELGKRAAAGNDRAAAQRAGIDSSLRFADAFGQDARTPAVLTNAADQLFALGDGERAASVAERVLDLKPLVAPELRRVAWTVVAHQSFERADFARAERAYAEVLTLTPERDAGRAALSERLAAAVYKQGEKARQGGDLREAVGHFNRIAALAPTSGVRATAQYDAAAALLALKDWEGGAKLLEDFRQRFPTHTLAGDVGGKLATAYLELQRFGPAAGEFERLAAASTSPDVQRSAQWQAAELYEKASQRPAATRVYERYLKQFPQPLDTALEARFRLARLAKEDGNAARELALMKELLQAEQAAGSARNDRTRALGAKAALVAARPVVDEYRKIALVEPLARQLKAKKAKMEEALQAYNVAATYGVAEVVTASTFQIASLYQDFGKSLLGSQRPKKLSKLELEQYNVLLEEQAFPFEEKAIELHETNVKRSAQGVYDDWVRQSYQALAEMRPVRYGKVERSEGSIDAIR